MESDKNPSGVLSLAHARERARPGPVPVPTTTTPNPHTSGVDVDGWQAELMSRGVVQANAASLVAAFDGERVRRAVEWFDEQRGVGPGVLVLAVREGRQLRRRDSESDRARRLQAWCDEHLPEFCDESGRCNPLVVGKAWRFECDVSRLDEIRVAARDVINRLGEGSRT